MATSRSVTRATSAAGPAGASPHMAAISTAAAASTASARAMAKALALSARVTRPAPSAQLRHALLAERSASSRSFASRMEQRRTATRSSFREPAEGAADLDPTPTETSTYLTNRSTHRCRRPAATGVSLSPAITSW